MRSAVLLAGGRSSRIGKEKALIPFRGKPLIQWVLDVLQEVADEIVVSVSPSPTEELIETVGTGVVIARDERSGMGPMEGLLSSFHRARGEYVAVAPCDAPFVTVELFDLLFEMADGTGGAVPTVGEHYEPLIAVYRCAPFLDALKRTIGEGRSKPIDTYPLLDLRFVEEAEIARLDLPVDPFTNINLLKDLEKVNKK
jgi:molybdopterin-guanine dinucleotide biosynthesis protein A